MAKSPKKRLPVVGLEQELAAGPRSPDRPPRPFRHPVFASAAEYDQSVASVVACLRSGQVKARTPDEQGLGSPFVTTVLLNLIPALGPGIFTSCSSFMASMGLAKRRHNSIRVLARRSKRWKALAFPWVMADGSLMPALGCHFLKTTARPCSCYVCKRPRYKRGPKEWGVKDL